MSKKSQKTNQPIKSIIEDSKKIILSNSEQKFIMTTEDKLHLAFNESLSEHKYISRIFNGISIFLAFLIPLLTSTFNDFPGLSSDVLKGIFIAVCVISAIYIIFNIVQAVIHRKDYKFGNFVNRIADKESFLNDK